MTVPFLALHPRRAGRVSMVALQWTVALVLILQALVLAFSTRAGGEFTATGLSPLLRPCLAWTELLAALLFLYPRTLILGAFGLLGVLLATVAVHLYLAQGFAGLFVYMAAIVAVVTHRPEQSPRLANGWGGKSPCA